MKLYIQSNNATVIPAAVSKYSFLRYNDWLSDKDVVIMKLEDYPEFLDHDDQFYLRAEPNKEVWLNSRIQSFAILRFLPPKLQNFSGRALVIDPDVFCVGDIQELWNMDMEEKSIFAWDGHCCYPHQSTYATSVMLLDCSKLQHWNPKKDFDAMFSNDLDYENLLAIAREPKNTIGILDQKWNSFDLLESDTRILHNTKRDTQPWRTGIATLEPNYMFTGKKHPDQNQEDHFFKMLAEMVKKEIISKELIDQEIKSKHIRKDTWSLIDKF